MLLDCDISTAQIYTPSITPRLQTSGGCNEARYLWFARSASAAGPVDLDVEVADFLAQGVAVEAEQIRRPDLVAAGGGQRGGQQRHLDFAQDPMIQAGRRHAIGKARKMRRQVDFDGAAEIV